MDQQDDFTTPLAVALLVALAGGFLLWTSAHFTAYLGDGLPLLSNIEPTRGVFALVQNPGAPATAWQDPSVGHPLFYWIVFAVQLFVIAALALALVNYFQTDKFGLTKRQRLNADTEAALASIRQLAPLKVDDFVPDRFSLGRLDRHYLAAENRRSKYDPGPQSGKDAKAVGDRGPIMFVGPTRSGKTVGVIAGMLTWHGPMIAASIKDDLIRPTLATRRKLGQTAVFDPTESILESYRSAQRRATISGDPKDGPPKAWDERLRINWSPLATIKDYDDAQRVSDSISEAAPGPTAGETGKGDFWLNSAKQILAPLLYIAALTGRPFDAVVDWSISPPDPESVSPYAGRFNEIRAGLPLDQHPAVDRVETRLNLTLANPDVKTSLNDVYATLRTIVAPWFSDRLSKSASGKSVDLEWLLGGGHEKPRSFYLAAPPNEAKRLQAVFGGVVNELIRQVYTHVEAHGPIEPPLLIVLDEAANMPLPMLSEYTSTLAGYGVQLVTVFQDLSQVWATYGQYKAASIVNNHTSRMFFRGLADEVTAKWIESATGSEEVEHVTTGTRGATDSDSHSTHRLALLPSNVVRQQPKFEALLIHGGLPAAHIKTHEWFESRKLLPLTVWPEDIDPDQGIPKPTAENRALDVIHTKLPLRSGDSSIEPARAEQPTSMLTTIPPKSATEQAHAGASEPTVEPPHIEVSPATPASPLEASPPDDTTTPKGSIADHLGLR